jgi:hypothetical protein
MGRFPGSWLRLLLWVMKGVTERVLLCGNRFGWVLFVGLGVGWRSYGQRWVKRLVRVEFGVIGLYEGVLEFKYWWGEWYVVSLGFVLKWLWICT